ncbi:MAG: ABC transporter substrate-binding protein, partial [Spirochaetaceae bacterium]|nr:ABC transporter substrate-binding protein [Spirochaetaceae bacterium]
NVKVPAGAVRTKDVTVDITVSSYEYPNSAKTPLDAGKITASLQLPDGSEKVYVAKKSKDGLFQATIPAKDMSALKPGNYTLVVQSQVSTEAPAVSPATIVLF